MIAKHGQDHRLKAASCLHVTAKHFRVESFALWTKTLALIGHQKAGLDKISFRPMRTLSVEMPLGIERICRRWLAVHFDHAQILGRRECLNLVGPKSNKAFGYPPNR